MQFLTLVQFEDDAIRTGTTIRTLEFIEFSGFVGLQEPLALPMIDFNERKAAVPAPGERAVDDLVYWQHADSGTQPATRSMSRAAVSTGGTTTSMTGINRNLCPWVASQAQVLHELWT